MPLHLHIYRLPGQQKGQGGENCASGEGHINNKQEGFEIARSGVRSDGFKFPAHRNPLSLSLFAGPVIYSVVSKSIKTASLS